MLTEFRDYLHAQLCYHLFITPLPIPLEKEYRNFAHRGLEFLERQPHEIIKRRTPRPHVLHRFPQTNNPNAKKILIAHGWMSRAAYMVRFIRSLHREGYDVYALDFPAHGEASGWQLPWLDAVAVLKDILDELGPFYAVLGHSFGGSMLLNLFILGKQTQHWELKHEPEKAIILASPTCMRTPVSKLARNLRLSSSGFVFLRNLFKEQSKEDIRLLNFRPFAEQATLPILFVHGKDDATVSPQESIRFCRRYPHATLAIVPNVDHVSVIIDERVEHRVIHFLKNH